MSRVPTGIGRLDELMSGGFPKGSIIIVCGPPGSGKTILSMQIALNLAKNGRNILYLLTGIEDEADLIAQAESLGMNFSKQLEGKIIIKKVRKEVEMRKVLKDASASGFSVVIIDSISNFMRKAWEANELKERILVRNNMIVEVLNPEFIIRNVIRKLLHYLRQLKFDLTILTSDRIKGEHGYTLDKISEFMADGIIELDTTRINGTFRRTLRIIKLKKTNHSMMPISFSIKSKKGIIFLNERTGNITQN